VKRGRLRLGMSMQILNIEFSVDAERAVEKEEEGGGGWKEERVLIME
jgi:hypothetical protein